MDAPKQSGIFPDRFGVRPFGPRGNDQGGRGFSGYSIPKGCVAANGLAYSSLHRSFARRLGGSFTVHAIYAPKFVDRLVRTRGDGDLGQYMHRNAHEQT